MKKSLFLSATLFSLLALTTTLSAQELGIRFGDSMGAGNYAAVDAVFSVGEFSRVHANVSFGAGVGAEAMYDFIYKPLGSEPALNWYAGVGPALFLGSDVLALGASGEVGLEYRFSGAPLSLSVDWRPTFVVIETTSFEPVGFGLNLRYVFGK